MHIVDIEGAKPIDFYVSCEHWKSVQLSFVFPPVISFLPPCNETLDVGERRAVFPACILELIGKSSKLKFSLKCSEGVVCNRDLEKLLIRHEDLWGSGSVGVV